MIFGKDKQYIDTLQDAVMGLQRETAELKVDVRNGRNREERLERDMQELMAYLGLEWEKPTGRRIVKTSERLKQDDVRFKC